MDSLLHDDMEVFHPRTFLCPQDLNEPDIIPRFLLSSSPHIAENAVNKCCLCTVLKQATNCCRGFEARNASSHQRVNQRPVVSRIRSIPWDATTTHIANSNEDKNLQAKILEANRIPQYVYVRINQQEAET